jgi:hypothetical protein
MNNRTFTKSLLIIGILCIFTSTVQALDTNMSISNETIILLFSFFLLSFGIYKEDSVIGFLCCFGSGFIFSSAMFNNLISAELHQYIIIIIIIAISVGAYKSFLYYDEQKSRSKKE